MDLLAARTLPLPRVLWIELTSRCPFDCIFCTRASLRGAGEHLDFALYQRVIGELDSPQIIRLNYAGESGHYPKLAQAVALAADTGAAVELVSALATLKPERLQAALDAGLSRLTVSLHTLDGGEFDAIYRFGSLGAMHQRLQQVLDWRARSTRPFTLDLAFVAMQRNLDQLPQIAAFAAAHSIGVLAVHPLIGRDPLPMGPATEHAGDGSLSGPFRQDLQRAITAARALAPQVQIQVSSFELQSPRPLAPHPQAWPWPLPANGRIGGCDQSPFDSVHILADGHVVACEVTEKRSLGNLHQSTLREIWHSPEYQAFRAAHWRAESPACRSCSYKTAYRESTPRALMPGAEPSAAQWLRGWHPQDGSGVRWCGREGAFWLPRRSWQRRLQLRGILAPVQTPSARLQVRINGEAVHDHVGAGPVELLLPLPSAAELGSQVLVELVCPQACSPHRRGDGVDVRELGFALIAAQALR